jgi:Na+/H+ antiporter NhaD/arsenite permease-like protein
MSISLDAAGLFRFLAFWAARKGGKNGGRLFAYLYVWFLVCGVVVGNVGTIHSSKVRLLMMSVGPRYPLRNGVSSLLYPRFGVSGHVALNA